jgi:thioredoxin reductase
VVIVGAGPAGLSAALILGRACRSVLVCDSGTPRSWASKHMHGFITREGLPPDVFRGIARAELRALPTVRFLSTTVTRARRLADNTFRITADVGRTARSRKLLIATGVFDHLPALEGVRPLFGRSVFQCPYCDGFEVRGRALAVYGRGQRGVDMAHALTAWTDDVVLCTNGPSGLSAPKRAELRRNHIVLREERIARLEGRKGQLTRILFQDAAALSRDALFFNTPSSGQSRLAESLGCQFTRVGGVRCGQYEATSVPGVFVAGNIIRDVQLSIVAAAEGARAAFGINRSLTREDCERRAFGRQIVAHPGKAGPAAPKRRSVAPKRR